MVPINDLHLDLSVCLSNSLWVLWLDTLHYITRTKNELYYIYRINIVL